MENYSETEETGLEIDRLLEAAAKRGLPLKMPKAKPHWKHRAQKLLQRSRKHEKRGAVASYRAAYRNSLRGQWVKLRGEMKRRGIPFELEYGDWLVMWTSCRTASIGQLKVPAWQYRGRKKDMVQLFRVEKDKPWCLENVEIWQKVDRLWP